MTQSSPRHTKYFAENSHMLPSPFPTPVVPTLPPFGGPSGDKGRENRELGKGETRQGEEDVPHSSMGRY